VVPTFSVHLLPPSSGWKSEDGGSGFFQKHWCVSTVAGITSIKTVIFRIEMVAYISSDLIFCMLFGNFVY
jgi:hypothetical protein